MLLPETKSTRSATLVPYTTIIRSVADIRSQVSIVLPNRPSIPCQASCDLSRRSSFRGHYIDVSHQIKGKVPPIGRQVHVHAGSFRQLHLERSAVMDR